MVNIISKLSTPIVVVSAVTGIAVWLYYRKNNSNRIPRQWKLVGYVEEMVIYPVKSCGYQTLNEAHCTEQGLAEIPSDEKSKKHLFRDREFVIYDIKEKKILKLLKSRKAVLISVYSLDEDTVVFQAPGINDYELKLSPILENPKPIEMEMHGAIVKAADCGDNIAEWLSDYLVGQNEGFRLGYHVQNVSKKRNVVKILADKSKEFLSTYKHIEEDDGGLYSDLTSYMVASKSSLDELNSRLPEEDQSIIYNFRPNIIVKDCKPFEEDEWTWIKIGTEIVMHYVKPCTRCPVTTINANTGERNKNLQPFKELKSYRTVRQVKGHECEGDLPIFGAYMGLNIPGKIKVGDPVYASF